MPRESKKKTDNKEQQQKPEVLARKRLKSLAFSNNILSETPAKTRSALNPSTAVSKQHGKDLLRKSNRKNRFLFSFPGLLAPLTGGKIGELKDLSTKNPVLYLDFPQGQMKLFGSIVYPKNKYLTLQFPRGGKSVLCEDYFDNMIVFSDAWWIGTKKENPEEAQLDFPKELVEEQPGEHDFKGGAGAASTKKQVSSHKRGPKYEELDSPEMDMKNDWEDVKESTPVRHSERTAKRTFKYTDGYDSIETEEEEEEAQEEEEEEEEEEDEGTEGKNGGGRQSSVPVTKSRKLSESTLPKSSSNDLGNHGPLVQSTISTLFNKAQEKKHVEEDKVSAKPSSKDSVNHGPLVQATISTLFNKVQDKKHVEEDKKLSRSTRKSPSSKVFDQKLKNTKTKRKSSQSEGTRKRGKVEVEENINNGKGTGSKGKEKALKVDEDEIEEISSSSQDSEGSDEDWAA